MLLCAGGEHVMALILGLDIATVTGFAWYDDRASLSAIHTGLIKAQGEGAEEKAASLALQLVALLKPAKPDFVAIEQPMRNLNLFKRTREDLGGTVEDARFNPNALQLEGLCCAAVAIVAAYRIPWETIPSSTWRKAFLGVGRSPGFDRQAWKRAAVDRCRALKIEVRNADAAEAVGAAFAGSQTQAFKMLRERVAA
jgi:Holliday junction resolvasome RuvABC endonuclease subunit